MYPVSDAYKLAMHQRVQSFSVRGTIGYVSFTEANILAGSLSITNQCSGNDMLEIGQVYIGELNCTFLNVGIDRYDWYGKEIALSLGLKTSGSDYEFVPLGIFTVSAADYTESGVVVKAYDHMAKLDKPCASLGTGAKPYNLVKKSCDACGVTLETTEQEFQAFANGNVTLGLYAENDIETYRDALSWLAQTCGCFVTASRTGGIVFKQYGGDAVDVIDNEHRFTGGSFSDYSTRYSGLSIVNIEKQTTSYYGLDPDDALTYNLGSNPYLQISISHSLTTMRRNVLNALSTIDYMPFKVTCIGNPAYDLGDVLVFSDGLADGDKEYCITKFSWTYGLGYTMEGVGKNPALASANSKSDKNIAGLISQTVASDAFKCTVLRNGDAVTISDGDSQSVIFSRYLTSSACHVRINLEVLLTVNPTNDVMEVRAKYLSDGIEITDRYPIETWHAGKHILTLQYDLDHDDSVSHSFDLWLEASGGSVSVNVGDAYEVISSTGLAADSSWEGTFRGEDGNLYIVVNGQAHKIPDSIEVAGYPDKISYGADEQLDYSGVKINALFGDGSKVNITNDCTFNPANGSPYDTEADYYIEVGYATYGVEYETGFDLFYNYLKGLVFTNPAKINYKFREVIDYTGLRVFAAYRDGTQIDVTKLCTITPANGTIFDFDDRGTLSKITVTTQPIKTTYKPGEEIIYAGIVVTASYTNQAQRDVTNFCTFNPGSGKQFDPATDTQVIISYTVSNVTKTATFALMEQKTLSQISVTRMPTKSAYEAGEEINYAGAVITATYSDNSTANVTNKCTFSPADGTVFNPSYSGTEVSYTEDGITKTVTLTLQEKAAMLESISISAMPVNVVYANGDSIDYSGIAITAIYSDNTTADVTNACVFNPAGGSAFDYDNYTVTTISYTENGVTKTTALRLTKEGS